MLSWKHTGGKFHAEYARPLLYAVWIGGLLSTLIAYLWVRFEKCCIPEVGNEFVVVLGITTVLCLVVLASLKVFIRYELVNWLGFAVAGLVASVLISSAAWIASELRIFSDWLSPAFLGAHTALTYLAIWIVFAMGKLFVDQKR